MEPSLTETGLTLTLYGMGTVFVFLLLLIYATRAMSWFARHFGGSDSDRDLRIAAPLPGAAEQPDEIIAVISAAVRMYRDRRSR